MLLLRFGIIVVAIVGTCICQMVYADSADTILDTLKARLYKAGTKKERAEITLELSRFTSKSDAKAGLEYAEQFIKLAHEIDSDSLINRALLNLAVTNLTIGNYPRSLDFYQQVIKSNSVDSSTLLLAYNGIGIINYYQRDYKNALVAYTKALSFAASIDQKKLKQNLLNNLGILYEEMKDYEKSGHYYSESLSLSRQALDEVAIANVLSNQGRLYHKQGKDDLALQYYQEALKSRQDRNDENGMALSYDGLGEFYFDLKNYTVAEGYLKQAIKMAQRTGDLLTIRRSSSHLYKIYQKQEKYKLAFETLALNKRVGDSLFNDERAAKITQLKAEFEFERKHSEERARQREKELTYLFVGVGLLLSLIIVSLLFYLQRNKVKSSLLEQAHLKLEKESLEKDIQMKDKELTTSTIHLMQKNELIDDISDKLLKMKTQLDEDSKFAIQKVVTDLQSNLRPELLKEFEFRFQQVHENFYDVLNERFPNLTPSERKLCAFLKLGMTTKEISSITYQNIKSIEIARTRLRKKLNLTNQDYNLVTFLSQLS
ncbi:tetratricopeptide repeat protein [Sphingobacterium lumbrici]|uniref:tetratricopeptide repeat protein n=1 Tax=Sphingobacterium lumbrici TaxID=2559600 RepID=UPI00112A1BBA|nr:tetratricopeptide repeat protein [Sphingobacterium lumbrici]